MASTNGLKTNHDIQIVENDKEDKSLTTNLIVGLQINSQAITEKEGKWIGHNVVFPSNIYEAQLERRLNLEK